MAKTISATPTGQRTQFHTSPAFGPAVRRPHGVRERAAGDEQQEPGADRRGEDRREDEGAAVLRTSPRGRGVIP